MDRRQLTDDGGRIHDGAEREKDANAYYGGAADRLRRAVPGAGASFDEAFRYG